MSIRVGIPVRLLSILLVVFLGFTACASDPDAKKEQSSSEVPPAESSEVPPAESSEEPREPADAYQDFVAAVEDDDLASFTSMLAPGFAGLEAEGVGSCEYGEPDADTVFACLSAASESGELKLAPEPEWTMTIRDGLGQQFSGSELDGQVTDLLDSLSDAVAEDVQENDVRSTVAPKALQDGSDLNVLMVLLDAEWRIVLIEQG